MSLVFCVAGSPWEEAGVSWLEMLGWLQKRALLGPPVSYGVPGWCLQEDEG